MPRGVKNEDVLVDLGAEERKNENQSRESLSSFFTHFPPAAASEAHQQTNRKTNEQTNKQTEKTNGEESSRVSYETLTE